MSTLWKSAASYVIGRSHEKEQKPCQDRVFTLNRDGRSFVGVCDGAGSASHSQYGAEKVLEVVAHLMINNFTDFLLLEPDTLKEIILEEVKQALTLLAEEHHVSPSALASTLLFVISDEHHFISGHIGDGLIVALTDTLLIHSYPENGDYENVTYFTTSSDALQHFRIQIGELSEKQGFCLMSDGTSSTMYRKQDNTIAPAIMTIAAWLRDHDEQVVTEAINQNLYKVIRQKTFDDCALAIMVKL